MNGPQVMVAHPGKQHSPQTALAFQEIGLLAGYHTSVWYKPGKFPYSWISQAPGGIRAQIRTELARRYYLPALNPDLVVQTPWLMALRILIRRCVRSESLDNFLIYCLNRSFDHACAAGLRARTTGDVLIGYEVSSWRSFQYAKKSGIMTILDLASVAWPCQQELLEAEGISPQSRRVRKMNHLKQAELELADFILVGSGLAMDSLGKAGIDRGKARVIPYGTDITRFCPKSVYPRKDRLTILYVGAISRHKGVEYLLEMVKQSADPGLELVMVGGLGDAAPLLSSYEGLFQHVPFLPQEELVPYYQGADVLVLPSLIEGFGQVTLEAMACGTPVIVTENCGSKEVVQEGVNGFVIPVRDVEALKKKILFFHHHRDQLELFGRAARETAAKFTWEIYRQRVRETILALYRDHRSQASELRLADGEGRSP
jgi:alpha-maltose-1-phosphate synthase